MLSTLCRCQACVATRETRYAYRLLPCLAPPTHRVAIGLLQEGDTYLVGLRPENRPLPNVYEFPGGKAEPGESLKDCLIREWREELALTIRVGARIWSDVFVFPDGVFEVTLFRVARARPREAIRALVHQSLHMATIQEIRCLPIVDSMYYILDRLEEESV